MTQERRTKERREFKISYQGKFFVLGLIIGAILSLVWQDYFVHYHLFSDKIAESSYIKQDTNERLLDYIDGTWNSSIGDVKLEISNVETDTNKFLLLEVNSPIKGERKFKVIEILEIEGLFGIVKLNICELDIGCKENNIIPIQVNKVFGIKDTIIISYDSRLTFCVDDSNLCSRAFKRI